MSSAEWVKVHYQELQKKYATMYIAVTGSKIIAYEKTLSTVLKKTKNIECTIEFIQSDELFVYYTN